MWLLIAFLLLLTATAVILIPFFRSPTAEEPDVEVDPTLLALYNRRDQLYQAIREAKFDLDTGKLSPEDYERQVAHLKRQAASVLKAIDKRQKSLATAELDAQVEEMVRAERREHPWLPPQPAVITASAGTASTGTFAPRYCPKCGARVKAGDRFCPACGNRLFRE